MKEITRLYFMISTYFDNHTKNIPLYTKFLLLLIYLSLFSSFGNASNLKNTEGFSFMPYAISLMKYLLNY